MPIRNSGTCRRVISGKGRGKKKTGLLKIGEGPCCSFRREEERLNGIIIRQRSQVEEAGGWMGFLGEVK